MMYSSNSSLAPPAVDPYVTKKEKAMDTLSIAFLFLLTKRRSHAGDSSLAKPPISYSW